MARWGRRATRRLRRRSEGGALRRRWRLDVVKTRAGAESIRNWRIDRRYGGWCGGTIASRYIAAGSYGTSSVDYWQLRRIFCAANGLEIKPREKLVDVGCGKGRVLNYWLSLGLANPIVGLELDSQFAYFARRRLARHANVEVLTGDAIELLPADASIMFVFNPFAEPVVARLRNRIAELYPAGARLRIVYYFPMHRDVFDGDPRFEVTPLARKAFHPGVVVRRVA
ncbi:MAG: class I SAM-dependent methyltransferase [Solirubrobacteraceae bacterium]